MARYTSVGSDGKKREYEYPRKSFPNNTPEYNTEYWHQNKNKLQARRIQKRVLDRIALVFNVKSPKLQWS